MALEFGRQGGES